MVGRLERLEHERIDRRVVACAQHQDVLDDREHALFEDGRRLAAAALLLRDLLPHVYEQRRGARAGQLAEVAHLRLVLVGLRDLIVEEGGDDDRLRLERGGEQRPQLLLVLNVGVATEELHARLAPEEDLADELVVRLDALDKRLLHAAILEHRAELQPQRRLEREVDVEDLWHDLL